MVKVYKKGVNVFIVGFGEDTEPRIIPTHQTRFKTTPNSITIIDLFPSSIDQFVIQLDELEDLEENAISTKLEAIDYLSGFIGQSFGGGGESTSIPTSDLPKWNSYALTKSNSGTDEIETYVFKLDENIVATIVLTTDVNGNQTATKS